VRARLPGVVLCVMVSLAAGFVAGLHGGPQLLYALFFGVCFHYLHDDERTREGIAWCGKNLLRTGVALLGARITAVQIGTLGWTTVAIVVTAVVTTIGVGILLARLLGLTATQGLLSGGATAICGASAALAISAVLPRSREQERFTLVVVVGVTSLSTLAMLSYPSIARAFGLSPTLAGLFLGGTIHDVAQVVGAGYLMGPATGDHATIVKLLRISTLAVVVAGVSVSALGARRAAQPGSPRPPLLPGFLQGFAALVALNSLGWIPPAVQASLGDVSRASLVIAISALGIKTSLGALVQAGWKCLWLLLLETLWLTALVLVAILWLRP
jgi:uncharacterized integral membrane protein (TIGR00698 family)